MATVYFDGNPVEVNENENVLECALNVGIYIPHLCHHKDLNPLGSCRLCIVEVEGEEGVMSSCTLKAKDGMKIKTNSPKVEQLRMLAMELLLAGHPEDCSTCPKYGKCELQTVIQYIGPKTGRMKLRTKGFATNEENPLIIHDMNRCVLCGRCIRACADIRGVGVLEYQKKDLETHVGVLHEKLLKDVDCRFCGACVEVCPTGSIRDKLMIDGVTKEDAIVPCRAECPVRTDIPRYIRYAKEGNYDAAVAVIREKAPFPKILGNICTHVCESKCKRAEVSEAMSIRGIKRYAAERDQGSYWIGKGKQLPSTGKKVCVVGGGPTGLTAAYYLRKQGHRVTLKEELPTVGGMMAYGIPAYRLPRTIIEEEVEVIINQGVMIETSTRVENPADLLNEYDAVLMAIGSHKGVRLPMQGNELQGVLINTEFLRHVSKGEDTAIGQKVIVLGGGNVAFDCARTAKRLGAQEVHVACLEAFEQMTADLEEIEEAKKEGILIHPAQTFECITGEQSVIGVDFMNVKSFSFDKNGRAIIEKKEDSLHHIDADTVIFAVGQRPDIAESANLTLGKGNSIVVNHIEKDKTTSVKGIFAAGDAIYGTKSVVMAIQSGREAASQIDKYLGGDGDISEVFVPQETPEKYIGKISGFGYKERKELCINEASDHESCDGDICGEAERCLQCDLRLHIAKPRLWVDFDNGKGAE